MVVDEDLVMTWKDWNLHGNLQLDDIRTFGHSLIPIMIRPEEKAIGSIAIEFVPGTTYDDETSRFLAFSKCYAIHQVMHYGETTMDQGVWMELDPMDWFLIGDVINSAKRAYRDGLLWMDPSSDLYGEFMRESLVMDTESEYEDVLEAWSNRM